MSVPNLHSASRRIPMMIDALASTSPVLAAGWSLLYLLCGGGVGGAVLIFVGLKAIGR
jgi:hypothetical protein